MALRAFSIPCLCLLLSACHANVVTEPVERPPGEPSSSMAAVDPIEASRQRLDEGRFEAVVEVLALHLELHPDDRQGHRLVGQAHFELGRYGEARVHFELALALDDSDPLTHLWMGKVLAEEIQRAMVFAKLPLAKKLFAHFTRAAEIDPDSVPAHTALARFHLEAPALAGGSAEKLRHHTDRLHQLDAAAGHRLEARIHLRDGDPAAAERELRLAVDRGPVDGENHFDLGALLLRRGQPEDALPLLEQAVQLSPDQHGVHVRLGEAALQVDPPRLEVARRAFETYLRRYPTHELPSRGEAWFLLGRTEELAGNGEEARRCYRRALDAAPSYKEAAEALEGL